MNKLYDSETQKAVLVRKRDIVHKDVNATSPTIKTKLVIKFSDTIATKYTHPEATKYTSVADNYH